MWVLVLWYTQQTNGSDKCWWCTRVVNILKIWLQICINPITITVVVFKLYFKHDGVRIHAVWVYRSAKSLVLSLTIQSGNYVAYQPVVFDILFILPLAGHSNAMLLLSFFDYSISILSGRQYKHAVIQK